MSEHPRIDADDVVVADLLASTLQLIAEAGGWVHPDVSIVARDGELSLTCLATDAGEIVRVPRAAFVRIGRVAWTDSVEELAFAGFPTDLDDVELELLLVQTALHNRCGKVPWLTRTHPVLASDLSPRLVDAVRAFRPSFRRRRPTAASLLWSTRTFRLPVADGEPPEPVALPIVDLLNHHPSGATGRLDPEGFTVSANRPFGTHECALDYGLERDAIGMAVVYGFADLSSLCAHSAPMSIDVAGVGEVEVAAVGRARDGRLLAPVVREEGGHTHVSHLTFRPGGRHDLVRQVPAAIVDSVAQRNLELLSEVGDAARAHDGPAALTLAAAAERQGDVIASGIA